MNKKHPTVLSSLTNRLEVLRDQQIRPMGIAGLGGKGLSSKVPGIEDSHSVSHTHPYRFDTDDDDAA